ncbi:RND family efflux transporter MFP subunit [Galbibacter marinus]|uniref:RND family efflux transporter MFP subunit n=1 Tax=Galbibacter marinus TaxID=555500 RepID=K2PSR2_9FLAO|nr:efflux RND transporter periplasmic adaptor subunit [Galbibacter marinus]EKF54619.1 RND family efflux transporter MFP subunit [Galbibacter marinus]
MDIPLEKKRFTTSRIFILTTIVLFIAFVVFVIVSSSGPSKLNVENERLTISEAVQGVFQEDIPVNGIVLPITTIYLDAVEGGRVEEKFVEDGAIMKKGEPILRLSNTDLELSLVNQETAVYNLLTQMQIQQNSARQNTINRLNQLTDVKNKLIEAKRVYNLNQKLYDKDAIGRQDLIASENEYNYQKQRLELAQQVVAQDSIATNQEFSQAQDSYQRTRTALELMRKKVGDLIVRAPVDGQLTSLDAEIGQSKTKGERLGQIDVLSGYKVRVEVDEHYIARIYAGQIGTFNFSGKTYTLEIKKVYTQVINGRFLVDMHFQAEVPAGIRRGQTLQIRVALSQEKQALLIPKGGFFQQTGGNWIFKLNKDQTTAYRQSIQLGNQNTEFYEVIDGLNPGDKVITSGYDNYGEIQELILN